MAVSRIVRFGLQLLIAGALITLGVVGALATHAEFMPCEIDGTSAACLDAMDGPWSFYGLLSALWPIAVALTAFALALAVTSKARWTAGASLLLALIMNPVTEYMIWLGFYGGHWDVPPGTGYTMSAAFILAGALVAVSAAFSLGRKRELFASNQASPLVLARPDAPARQT